MESLELSASQLVPRRIIYACGASVAILLLGFVLVGVVVEAQQLWRNGAAEFFADAGMRLVFGALVALLSAAPYVLLARAARWPGPPVFFAIIGVLTLAAQLWLTISALFFGRTSTAAIGVLFIPLYMCVAVAAVWGVAALTQWLKPGRTA
jgi:hypothetical protein